jgi:hypothetical protein
MGQGWQSRQILLRVLQVCDGRHSSAGTPCKGLVERLLDIEEAVTNVHYHPFDELSLVGAAVTSAVPMKAVCE